VPLTFDLTALWSLGVAVLGGLAVGVEREWSGHAKGPRARFAGVRTFTMLGLVSGLSGWLWSAGLEGPSIVLLAGLGALVVVAYLAASRRDVDGTTEVAAFVVLTAGVLAGLGSLQVASAIIAVTVLLLVEKKQLHGLVSQLDRVEIRAGARFAVMAVVILPLLPSGPFGPWGGVRPRALWALVLFFSGLSFVGYLARRIGGQRRGYAVAGTLGGIVSSTSVTLTLARLSRQHPTLGTSLASGTLGANVVLFPRLLIATAVLAPALTRALWPAFVAPIVIGSVLVWRGMSARRQGEEHVDLNDNPLQVGSALKMTVLFQAVLYAVWFAKAYFGDQGLYGSAAVLGLTDMDALTISMARLVQSGTAAEVAARAVLIGVIANTVVKFTLAVTLGRGTFRVLAAAGLALIGAAVGAALWLV